MGFLLKSSKCKSHSISSGKPKDITFKLKNKQNDIIQIDNLVNNEHKFLGQILMFENSPSDHFKLLKSKLESKLDNLDSTAIKSEYKLAVYSKYLIPSLRYHFSVHNVKKIHLEECDKLVNQFLKKWLKYQQEVVRI